MSLNVLLLICFVGVFGSSCSVFSSAALGYTFTTELIYYHDINCCSALGVTDLPLMHDNSPLSSIVMTSDHVQGQHAVLVHLSSLLCHLTLNDCSSSSMAKKPELVVAEVAFTRKAVAFINSSLIAASMAEVRGYGQPKSTGIAPLCITLHPPSADGMMGITLWCTLYCPPVISGITGIAPGGMSYNLPLVSGILLPLLTPCGGYTRYNPAYSLYYDCLWPQTKVQFDSSLTPSSLCTFLLVRMLNLFCCHSSMLRHDFRAFISFRRLALISSLYNQPSIVDANVYFSFGLVLHSLCQSLSFLKCLHSTVVSHNAACVIGGGCGRKSKVYFDGAELEPYIMELSHNTAELKMDSDIMFEFMSHDPLHVARASMKEDMLLAKVPLEVLIVRLPNIAGRDLIRSYGMFVSQRSYAKQLLVAAKHISITCSLDDMQVSVFKLTTLTKNKRKHEHSLPDEGHEHSFKFPPSPPSSRLCDKIIRCFCADSAPNMLSEKGCAVCGQLVTHSMVSVPLADLTPEHLTYLTNDVGEVTKSERNHGSDPHLPMLGPVLAPYCDVVCTICRRSLKRGHCPKNGHCQQYVVW